MSGTTIPKLTEEQLKEALGAEKWERLQKEPEDVQKLVEERVKAVLAEEAEKAEAEKKRLEEEARKGDLSEIERLREELAEERKKNAEERDRMNAFMEEYRSGTAAKVEKQKAANAEALAKMSEKDQEFVKKYGRDNPETVASLIADVQTRSGGGSNAGSTRQTSFQHDKGDKGNEGGGSPANKTSPDKVPTMRDAEKGFQKAAEEFFS